MFIPIKIFMLSVLMLLTGCSSVASIDHARVSSTAFKDYQSTYLGQFFKKVAIQHPGKSGFHLIPYGREAFTARIAMVKKAQKSLDLQYYLWEPDASGLRLAYHLIKAADRGVKIRILLDDYGLEKRDEVISIMDTHPNIQIHIFNPFRQRNFHLVGLATEFKRLNHRMHNKTFVADNALGIIGGRNIGDHYFGVSDESNWRDLDIAAAGPIVREVSGIFDYFWNGDWAVPINSIAKQRADKKMLPKLTRAMQQRMQAKPFPYALDEDVKKLNNNLRSIRKNFIWAQGWYIWNDPKIMQLATRMQKKTMIQQLKQRVKSVRKSLHIESAYLVPRHSGIEALKSLQKRGIKVQILTNSFASNDVSYAHAGYASYRKRILKYGVDLYELRPDASKSKAVAKQASKIKNTHSGLHTKAMIFDRQSIFVGSFNLDPRSAAINTEGGLYVKSPQLAKQLIDYMKQGIQLENSYKIELTKNGKLHWITQENGKQKVYKHEPNMKFMDRFKTRLIQILPVELQL